MNEERSDISKGKGRNIGQESITMIGKRKESTDGNISGVAKKTKKEKTKSNKDRSKTKKNKKKVATKTNAALTLFDTIEELEIEDVQAEVRRKKRSKTVDIKRSYAAQSQTKIYNHLVECRILLQRSLNAFAATSSENEQGENGQQQKQRAKLEDGCNTLLVSLLRARQQLLTGQISSKKETTNDDDDNDDDDDDDNEYSKLVHSSTLENDDNDDDDDDLHEILSNEYDTCKEQWKDIFNKRHKDIQLRSGHTTHNNNSTTTKNASSSTQFSFKIMNSSFWQQVESTVEYEMNMMRNTTTTHAQTTNRGEDDEDDEHDEKNDIDNEMEQQQTNNIHFEDSKIYQQLLKDFVATASSSSSSSSSDNYNGQNSAAYYRNQQQKSSSTAAATTTTTTDRKASKGRKIRYKEIPKLVNFTFPLSKESNIHNNNNNNNNSNGVMLDQDEWFKSLFGGIGSTR